MTIKTWVGGVGNYTTPTDWNPTGVPQAGDIADVATGTMRVSHLDVSGVTLGVGGLATSGQPEIDLIGATAGTLELLNPIGSSPHSVCYGVVGIAGHSTVTGLLGGQGLPSGVLTVNLAAGAVLANTGTILAGGAVTVTIGGGAGVVNTGTIEALGGTVAVATKVGGTGTVDIELNSGAPPVASVVEFGSAVGAGQTVNLDAGTLKLDDARHFLATIDGFNSAGTIELTGTTITSDHYANGVLSLFDGATLEARLHIAGAYTTASFATTVTGGNTFITVVNGGASALADTAQHGIALTPAYHGM